MGQNRRMLRILVGIFWVNNPSLELLKQSPQNVDAIVRRDLGSITCAHPILWVNDC